MMDMFKGDLDNAIEALQYYLTDFEMELLDNNQGGREEDWSQLSKYRVTLSNLKLMRAIYQ